MLNSDVALQHEVEIGSANMTTSQALELLRHVNGTEELLQLVQENLGSDAAMLQSALRGRVNRKNQPKLAGVDRAKTKLNAMIHETAVKVDLEKIRCAGYRSSQTALIEKLHGDISSFNSAAAAAASEILRAQSEISIYQAEAPQAKNDLEQLLKGCKQSKIELEHQLLIVRADINVMERVMGMTQCNSPSMLLLKCNDSITGRMYMKFSDETLESEVVNLKHPDSRHIFNDGMEEYPTDSQAEDGLPRVALDQEPVEPQFQYVSFFEQQPASNVTAPPPKEKQRSKCSVGSSPACPKLRERFMDIATSITDKKDELDMALRSLESRCSDSKSDIQGKVEMYESNLRKQQTALAGVMSQKVTNEEQSRLTQSQLNKAQSEYKGAMAECRMNIANFLTEKCGLSKIRTELYKLKGTNVFLQDCEVTNWAEGECSASCGGGTQALTRTVKVQPIGGAPCPPLTATQSCNQNACPVDCVLDDWTPWSACSADCGGGVRSMSRTATQQPEHGGDPCAETSKTESCNIAACDVDCVLEDWTAWTSCSKLCDGGTMRRKKKIAIAAVGNGKCLGAHSKQRLQMKHCNVQPCVNKTTAIMKCRAKLDVLLLLDGSGSLGQEGWAQTIKAGAEFSRAMVGDVKLAALLFSGPTTYRALDMCIGEVPGTPDLVNDCGIQWVSHLTNDTAGVARAIEGLKYPEKTTLTSLALSTAEAELSNGRTEAQSVVIVITDGKPLSEKRTSLAASSIRQKARLIWVPVGRLVPKKNVRKWASFPWQENVVMVDKFETLTTPLKMNELIADMCPSILSEPLMY